MGFQDQVASQMGHVRAPPAKGPDAKKPPKRKASPRIVLRYDMTVKQLASGLGAPATSLALCEDAMHATFSN